MTRLEAALARAGALLGEARDVVLERVDGPEPPGWCARRGWAGFLLGLPDQALARCEARGLSAAIEDLPGAPTSLRALCAAARALEDELGTPQGGATAAPALPGAGPRKAGQVAALVALARERGGPPPTRVVDVGAGRGHLTRALARALGVPALGLEREPTRVRSATALGAGEAARFEVLDARPGGLPLRPGDLLVGLHACGRLSDVLVEAAREAGVGLLLVGCCLQKTDLPGRSPLSAQGRGLGLDWPRVVLGLANLHDHAPAAAAAWSDTLPARHTRWALRRLLRARGVDLAPGDELRGLPRAGLQRGLMAAARPALAGRGLPEATPVELEEAWRGAGEELVRARRLALPRAVLGRPLELAVALDRARALEEAGQSASVRVAFGLAHGPRNLVVVGDSP